MAKMMERPPTKKELMTMAMTTRMERTKKRRHCFPYSRLHVLVSRNMIEEAALTVVQITSPCTTSHMRFAF